MALKKDAWKYALGIAFGLCIVMGVWKYITRFQNQGKNIWTCSTFFDHNEGERWDSFCQALDSIQTLHRPETLVHIHRWIVVNEYSASPKDNWSERIKEKYPFVEFIQKGPTEKGQARTLNILLEKIRGCNYWIHWEDTWICRRSCLDRAFAVMDGRPDIIQLQMTYHKGTVNWMDVENKRIHCEKVPADYCIIDPSPKTTETLQYDPYNLSKDVFPAWPLYSLLPSINRAAFYEDLGEFNEDPKLWPIKFEWDYARRWFSAGGVKAVLEDGPVYRPNENNHTSTYA